ncbi:MAG: hypothetical protein MJ158_01900 [Alphaproteobacteria bacterium]|nr:hypothetical protein [Alphaproteobacteria bacterium]
MSSDLNILCEILINKTTTEMLKIIHQLRQEFIINTKKQDLFCPKTNYIRIKNLPNPVFRNYRNRNR